MSADRVRPWHFGTMRFLPALSAALILTAACRQPDPAEDFRIEPPESMASELAVPLLSPTKVVNLNPELDLVIAGIRFTPDDPTVLRWFSDGPFELPPGEEMTFDIWFRPASVGPVDGMVYVTTDAGELSAPLALEGLPPVDRDLDGFSVAQGDCDDDNDAVYPEAPELCDGLDNDCDDSVDGPFDVDRDGFLDDERCPEALGPLDCNDSDATAFPGNVESCDGSDSDCNGVVDDIDELADLQDGVCEGALKRCTAGGPAEPIYSQIEGYEQTEFSCDSLDNDCDGSVDDFDRLGDGTNDCVDDDNDGEREVDGDCDDTDPERFAANCGAKTLIVTRNDDGFATVDLNSGRVDLINIGVRTYHGVAASPNVLWLAARDEARLIRYDLDLSAPLISSRFSRPPWAVEIDDASKDLMVLFGDGGVQLRDVDTGDFIREYDVGGSPTAWTKGPDNTFWICNGGEGQLTHASNTGVLGVAEITTACYGPPALDGGRIVVPGFDDSVLVELDTATLEETQARATINQPIRAAWIKADLWVTTSVTSMLEVYEGRSLLRSDTYEFDGQTQGLWYDRQRDLVWVAVFGNDEIIAFDRRTREVKTRLTVPDPVYLFPMPPGG